MEQFDLHLTRASVNDVNILFEWRNDDTVRKNSLSTQKITYEEHAEWFAKKINEKNCLLYICYLGLVPVGQIRIDVAENEGKISYSVDRKYRNKGIGHYIINNLDYILKENVRGEFKLIGVVKKTNRVSKTIFIKNGFNEEDSGEESIFYKTYILNS